MTDATAADLPPTLTLGHAAGIAGSVRLPGSKSLSNRILLLAALAEGTTRIENLLDSDDVQRMLDALARLGIGIEQDADACLVHGRGGAIDAPSPEALELHLGNAGTAMRPLTAALCLGHGHFVLTGDPRMQERPIGPLVDALGQLGADIRYLGTRGYPPLDIRAAGLDGGHVRLDASISSQFVTALLMAAPLARGPLTIERIGERVSEPYIDITLGVMARFGASARRMGASELAVQPGPYVGPDRIMVEGDASSASYFLAAAAIAGGPVRVEGVGSASVQGDVAFVEVLEAMGARVRTGEDWVEVQRDRLVGVDLDLNHIPDAAMTLATTALFAEGPTTIRNVANWRVKETDRLAAMATELRKTGARVTELEDGLVIEPPARIEHAVVDTYDDHRMAMCFALLTFAEAGVTIDDPACVSKTYPGFFDDFRRLLQPPPA